MKHTFLCSNCRSLLKDNPNQIPERCHIGYKLAESQYRSGDLDNALRNIGAAFEMSAMMLNEARFPKTFAADWLVATSEVLVRVLRVMDRAEDSIFINRKTGVLLTEAGHDVKIKRLLPKLARIARDAYGSKDYLRAVH